MHTIPLTISNQIQANLISYFRLFAGLTGIHFVEEDAIWITTNAGAPGNHILQARFVDERVEQHIAQTLQRAGQYANQIDWYVFPDCQPADLKDRMMAHGSAGSIDGTWQWVGKNGGLGGYWLLADLDNLPNAPVLDEAVINRFRIQSVDNHAMLESWRQISAEGFGGGDCQVFYDAYARHGYGADAKSLHYIGYLDDQPVTSGTLLLADGIAGLFDISTPSQYRRQGFGSAISWFMLHVAQQHGYRQAYVWSSAMGQRVYRGVGFVPVDIGMREYQWQKREL